MIDLLRNPVAVFVALVVTSVLLVEGSAGLVVVPFLAAWWWFLYRFSGRNPFPVAFTTTAVAGLFIVAGTIGYTLSKHDRFVAGTAWSDSVIWWEVGVGLALLLLAAYFWRISFRCIGSSSRAEL